MRSYLAVVLMTCAFALGLSPAAKAQVITAGPDSARVAAAAVQEADSSKWKPFNTWSRPAKAAFYSAVLPGLGQAYNKSYWKIPLVYATGAVIGFFIYDNNKKYQGFAQALRLRTDGDPTTIDAYATTTGVYRDNQPNNQGSINLQRTRDFHRKYRDLDIILGVLAWGLNIMEAHVHAHLKAFDVGEDLSFQMRPHLQPLAGTPSYAAGFSLQLNLK
jgi:hypothetical protein